MNSRIKKLLTLVLLVLGLVAVVGVALIVRSRTDSVEEEAPDVEIAERPIVSMTPSEDGHWLYLRIEKLVIDAEILDYELLYNLPDGRVQGVPGTMGLDGIQVVEKELLLGTESSGNYYYDDGVESGSVSLSFRDGRGRLVGKLTSDFALLNNTEILKSIDGEFELVLENELSGFAVVMSTLGYPGEPGFELASGPYGVFTPTEVQIDGQVKMGSDNVYYWDGTGWEIFTQDEFQLPTIFAGS